MATNAPARLEQGLGELAQLLGSAAQSGGNWFMEAMAPPVPTPEWQAREAFQPSMPAPMAEQMPVPGVPGITDVEGMAGDARTMEAIQALKDASARKKARTEESAKSFRQQLREAVSEGQNVFSLSGDETFEGKYGKQAKGGNFSKAARGSSERAMQNMDPVAAYLVDIKGYTPKQAYLTSRMFRSGAQQNIIAETSSQAPLPDGRALSGLADLAALGDYGNEENKVQMSQFVQALMNMYAGRR